MIILHYAIIKLLGNKTSTQSQAVQRFNLYFTPFLTSLFLLLFLHDVISLLTFRLYDWCIMVFRLTSWVIWTGIMLTKTTYGFAPDGWTIRFMHPNIPFLVLFCRWHCEKVVLRHTQVKARQGFVYVFSMHVGAGLLLIFLPAPLFFYFSSLTAQHQVFIYGAGYILFARPIDGFDCLICPLRNR